MPDFKTYFPYITAILVAIFGFLGGAWVWNKNKSDAAKSLIDSAMSMVKEYKEEIEKYREEREAALVETKEIARLATNAEQRASAAEARVSELERILSEVMKRMDRSEELRLELVIQVSTLETQLEALGYVPKTKLKQRVTDKKVVKTKPKEGDQNEQNT